MHATLDRPTTAQRRPADRRPPLVQRIVRSLGVSVATTLLSLTVLVALMTLGMGPTRANVIATVAGMGPSYVWNRRYAWKLDGRGRFTEAVPFWTMCVLGLVCSTVAVARAETWLDAMRWHGTIVTLAVLSVNVAVFGTLWVVQFLFLDRVLFRRRTS